MQESKKCIVASCPNIQVLGYFNCITHLESTKSSSHPIPNAGEYQDKTISVILERLNKLEAAAHIFEKINLPDIKERINRLGKDLLEKECGLIDFVKGYFLDKCIPINVVLDNHDNRIEKLEDIIDATEKVSLQTSLPDAIKEIERRLNVICQINSNHLGRIKELEENHEASRDTIGCVDSAYDEVCKKLEKRIEKLEEVVRGIEGFHHDRLMTLESSVSKLQQNPVPSASRHVCDNCAGTGELTTPVCATCHGKGKIETGEILTSYPPQIGYRECPDCNPVRQACNRKGIAEQSPIAVSIRKLEDKIVFDGNKEAWIKVKLNDIIFR